MGCSTSKLDADSFTLVPTSFWNIKVKDLEEKEISLSSYRNKKVFLVTNFPASSEFSFYYKKYIKLLSSVK